MAAHKDHSGAAAEVSNAAAQKSSPIIAASSSITAMPDDATEAGASPRKSPSGATQNGILTSTRVVDENDITSENVARAAIANSSITFSTVIATEAGATTQQPGRVAREKVSLVTEEAISTQHPLAANSLSSTSARTRLDSLLATPDLNKTLQSTPGLSTYPTKKDTADWLCRHSDAGPVSLKRKILHDVSRVSRLMTRSEAQEIGRKAYAEEQAKKQANDRLETEYANAKFGLKAAEAAMRDMIKYSSNLDNEADCAVLNYKRKLQGNGAEAMAILLKTSDPEEKRRKLHTAVDHANREYRRLLPVVEDLMASCRRLAGPELCAKHDHEMVEIEAKCKRKALKYSAKGGSKSVKDSE